MSIVLKSVDFEWPNGHAVFKGLNLTLESGRKYGLVGPNGVGKSTLAKLIQGELVPSRGKTEKRSHVSYFAQWESPPDTPVAEYLSDLWINVTPADTGIVEALQGSLDFALSCRALSGGEWTRARLLKQLSAGADFVILDEPTNNLDRQARSSVLDFVRRTTQGVLVISHDRELLGVVSSVLELSNQGLSIYGGNWDEYESARDHERMRLGENLEAAQNERDRAQQARAKKLEAQAKRMRQAKNAAPSLGLPKILLGARKRKAEKTLGKLREATDKELDKRVDAARSAFAGLKVDQSIYAEFPETAIPAGKLVFEARDLNFQYDGATSKLWKAGLSFSMKGAARVAIVGQNGSGKTTFLNLLTGLNRPQGTQFGSLKLGHVEYGLIDQHTALLDQSKTVFENAYETSQKSIIEIRNLLAQFLFPGMKADQVVSTLSGGERIRAALAKVMISDPAPQLLILDEPTNNLDMINWEFLEVALSKFEGALLVVSHDVTFLEKIRITEQLRVEAQ